MGIRLRVVLALKGEFLRCTLRFILEEFLASKMDLHV
jgi:hypothetical protein